MILSQSFQIDVRIINLVILSAQNTQHEKGLVLLGYLKNVNPQLKPNMF